MARSHFHVALSPPPGVHVFRPHVTLGDSEVAKEIAEGEVAFAIRPVNFVWWDTTSYLERALASVAEVLQKGLDGVNFHVDLDAPK